MDGEWDHSGPTTRQGGSRQKSRRIEVQSESQDLHILGNRPKDLRKRESIHRSRDLKHAHDDKKPSSSAHPHKVVLVTLDKILKKELFLRPHRERQMPEGHERQYLFRLDEDHHQQHDLRIKSRDLKIHESDLQK